MNLQAHMSGQISGQTPIQVGNQVSGYAQNGNALPSQIQNQGGQRNASSRDPELLKARRFIAEKIYDIIKRRQSPTHEIPQKKLEDLARRLEECLLKSASSQEDYMNLSSLESRLQLLANNQNVQIRQLLNSSSSSISTMIPTPGMSHGLNSSVPMVSASGCNSSTLSSVNGPSVGIHNNAPFTSDVDGMSNNRYLGGINNMSSLGRNNNMSSMGGNNNMSSMDGNGNMSLVGGINNVSSMGIQRNASQMIPTPGFNNNNNQSYVNLETSGISGGISSGESMPSTMTSQQKHQGGQNSRILHNLGSHLSSGIRSGLHPKPYGFSNGGLNGTFGITGNSLQNINGADTSQGFLTGTPYVNSSKPLQQHLDQNQRTLMQGDPSRSGNFYGSVMSSGLMMGSNLNQSNAQSLHHQAVQSRHQSIDQSEKMNIQIPSLLQAPQQQFQQIQPNNQFQYQNLQKQQTQQNQILIKKEPYNIPQLIKTEGGIEEYHNDVHMQQLPFEQFQLSELQNQFQMNSMDDPSRRQPQNDLSMQSQWRPNSQDIHEELRQRTTAQDEAHCNNFPSEGPISNSQIVAPTSISLLRSVENANNSISTSDKQLQAMQRWLLLFRHSRRCPSPEGKCQEAHCVIVQKLIIHMQKCHLSECPYPRCHQTRRLVRHHIKCRDPGCPVCVPVRTYCVQAQLKMRSRQGLNNTTGVSAVPLEEVQPPLKRIKTEQAPPSQSLMPLAESKGCLVPTLIRDTHTPSNDIVFQEGKHGDKCGPVVRPEFVKVKMDCSVNCSKKEIHTVGTNDMYIQMNDDQSQLQPSIPNEQSSFVKEENIKPEKDIDQIKEENNQTLVGEPSKSGKPKIKGVSLTELFTPEQVREHIAGLRQWVGQSKAKAEKNQAMEHSMSENSCQLCAVEKLTFEPPPTYCSPCGARIKRNAMYYTVASGDTRHYFCIPCYNESRGDSIVVDGTSIPKMRLEKKKNDEETEEWWVQCDKCENWQHQICALFNGRRNDGGQAEYTCPNCYIIEVERGERQPLPQSAVLGAKDLPRTILSDQIEQRLFKRLKQERQERARLSGRSYDEVPGADSLVVRVVSSVDKKLEVKQRFLEIFQEQNYPTEFPYKSKVVLLFQKIEGVEVCLFGMYVQEFGSECQFPNQRRVYLSYLDSVKYFRPEIKAVSGEALRTFLYHEILIGYLDYCKKRGFTSCYIWACPPLKGEDYILYCHPEIQKTPKSDKLREWYLSMLRKASKENIVVDLTTLYDHFFVTTGECKAKITAARLPYFDGDYWPGAAEDMIYQLLQEDDGKKVNKKGAIKKTISKRALKASGHTDFTGNASKDLLLMQKLGETISPMKEDFIMVHLQHACTHCCVLMVSGNRWVCKQCKNFQLCDKCYEAEQKIDERDRHPVHHREKHTLYPVEITDVPEDTTDKDEILESEFFDTRQAFLSLCQGNHYQYDTLRRAKHSSMMVLYHLHNPTAPAFVITCNMCHLDIEAGQGWRCEVCSDYDVCNPCYQKGIVHPHQLTNHPSIAERDAQNTVARQQRVVQLRKMLDLLVHASQCRSAQCQYPNCRKVKGLFRHGIHCKIRAAGGCVLCKKMWYLLQLHARACKVSNCPVPRCRDLKEHVRRLQQQSDSRRRAAVMEMMRQRAAEVAGNSG